MKLFIFATFLALALCAKVPQKDPEDGNLEMTTDKEKEIYADEVLKELENKTDEKCLPSLKREVFPVIKATIVKHLIRIIHREPIYKDKEREFELGPFIGHSQAYKQWEKHELKCVTSLVEGIGKAFMSAYKGTVNKLKGLVKLAKKGLTILNIG